MGWLLALRAGISDEDATTWELMLKLHSTGWSHHRHTGGRTPEPFSHGAPKVWFTKARGDEPGTVWPLYLRCLLQASSKKKREVAHFMVHRYYECWLEGRPYVKVVKKRQCKHAAGGWDLRGLDNDFSDDDDRITRPVCKRRSAKRAKATIAPPFVEPTHTQGSGDSLSSERSGSGSESGSDSSKSSSSSGSAGDSSSSGSSSSGSSSSSSPSDKDVGGQSDKDVVDPGAGVVARPKRGKHLGVRLGRFLITPVGAGDVINGYQAKCLRHLVPGSKSKCSRKNACLAAPGDQEYCRRYLKWWCLQSSLPEFGNRENHQNGIPRRRPPLESLETEEELDRKLSELA